VCIVKCLNFEVSFFSIFAGDGHYRTAGSYVFHQLLEEVPQHHLWASPNWSAAKCKYHRKEASVDASKMLLCEDIRGEKVN